MIKIYIAKLVKNKRIYLKNLLATMIITTFSINCYPNQLPDLIPFMKNGKFGFCNKNRQIIIPCKYYFVYPFGKNVARVRKEIKNGEYLEGLIDKKGIELIFCKDYGLIYDLSEQIDNNKKNMHLSGMVINKGNSFVKRNKIIFLSFIEIAKQSFIDGLENIEYIISLIENEYKTLVFEAYKFLNPCSYVYIGNLNDGYAIVSFDSNYRDDAVDNPRISGVIGFAGKIIVPVKYVNILRVSKEYFKVRKNGKCGLYDLNGNNVVICKYDEIYRLTDHRVFFIALQDSKEFYIDAFGNEYYE